MIVSENERDLDGGCCEEGSCSLRAVHCLAGSKSTWSMKRFAFVWFSMQASRNVVSFTTRTCKAQQSDKAGERERERNGGDNLGPDREWVSNDKLEELGKVFTLTIRIIVQGRANQGVSSKLFNIVFNNEVIAATSAYGFNRRLGGVEKKNPLPLCLNLRLDGNIPDLGSGAVVDAYIATERLSQIDRPE